jgi:hypothetical protein
MKVNYETYDYMHESLAFETLNLHTGVEQLPGSGTLVYTSVGQVPNLGSELTQFSVGHHPKN